MSSRKFRPSWKKTVSFISNQRKRQRFDADNVRQLKAKVAEWHIKTKVPVACFVYLNGRVNFITSPDMRELGQNVELQSIISKYICENNGGNIDQGTLMADSIFSLPENFDPSRENVHYLRDVVMDIVTRKGKIKANWGVESLKPYWWPKDIMFVSPKNNRSPNRPKRDDLIKILQAFIDSRAVMPSDIRIEGEETDEEQDEPVALPDQDTENLIDMINVDTTVDDGMTVLRSMSSIPWPSLESLGKSISSTAVDTCRSLLPKCHQPIQERHIQIWSRHRMPEKASGYEPVDILPGNNSLFRAASRTIYHDERFWPILKTGSLAKAVVESEYYVNQISDIAASQSSQNCGTPLEEIKSLIYDSISGAYSNDALSTLKLEASSLSRFTEMELSILTENTNEELRFDSVPSRNKLVLVRDAAYHFMPLARLESQNTLDERPRCDAGPMCILPPNEEQTVRCKHCLWKYHSSCVGDANATDDCGCSLIPIAKNRIDTFKSFSCFKARFTQFEKDLQELVEGLFCGTVQSCRNFANEEMRDELNCFVGGLPVDVDQYVLNQVESWIVDEKIQTPVDKRRLFDLFCHVATREVEIYICCKELEVGRLTAERVVRKFLASSYPS